MRRPKHLKELLISQPAAWPVPGYKLFDWKGAPHDLARLDGDSYSKLAVQSHGYKWAADTLVEQAVDGGGNANFFVWPILFCYRHFVELSLKRLLWLYGTPKWSDHRLDVLWKSLAARLDAHGVPNDKTRRAVTNQIGQLSKFDPKSTTGRYPKHQSGKPIILDIQWLDVERLEKGMDALEAYFSFLYECYYDPGLEQA